jgi:hypothetical protein
MHDDYISDMFGLIEQFGDDQTITVVIQHPNNKPNNKLYVVCSIADLKVWALALVLE